MEKTNLTWSFGKIWNKSVERGRPERPFKARETLWASELGGAMIDRYLKFLGEKPSNPPNLRSRRKFEAGNIWESILGLVLKRAGILLEEQGWVKYQYPKLLPVTGRKDFVAGGKPDWEKAKAQIAELEEEKIFPEFITRATSDLVDNLSEQHPNGLKKIILEIKSLSSFMFERYDALQTADTRHKMQLFHYLKADNLSEGHIVYVSKDDCRLLEIGVINPGPIEVDYKKDIEKFSWYVFKGEQPPKEKEIVFQPEIFKFSQNYKVGYSNYLTKLYGYKDQMEFETKYRPITARWNRVLNRFINNENITANNLEVVKEIEQAGFDFTKIVFDGQTLKQKGLIKPESEVENV